MNAAALWEKKFKGKTFADAEDQIDIQVRYHRNADRNVLLREHQVIQAKSAENITQLEAEVETLQEALHKEKTAIKKGGDAYNVARARDARIEALEDERFKMQAKLETLHHKAEQDAKMFVQLMHEQQIEHNTELERLDDRVVNLEQESREDGATILKLEDSKAESEHAAKEAAIATAMLTATNSSLEAAVDAATTASATSAVAQATLRATVVAETARALAAENTAKDLKRQLHEKTGPGAKRAKSDADGGNTGAAAATASTVTGKYCHDCDKMFVSNYQLKRHLNTAKIHSKQRDLF